MAKLNAIFMSMIIAGLVVSTVAGADEAEENAPGTMVRVGTFDSRAVAIAYYNSKPFKSEMKDLMAEHKKAKAEGNEERVKELEAPRPAQQELMHKQGFGTWPVGEILEKIKGQMTEIAIEAGVDVVISKWDVVYQGPGVEFVDVTDLIVKPFEPDEKTKKWLEGLKSIDPIPLEELEQH